MPSPYRTPATPAPAMSEPLRVICPSCHLVHEATWFYGPGDGDGWWGYCVWFHREVPHANVGCIVDGHVPPKPRGLRRLLMLLRGELAVINGVSTADVANLR